MNPSRLFSISRWKDRLGPRATILLLAAGLVLFFAVLFIPFHTKGEGHDPVSARFSDFLHLPLSLALFFMLYGFFLLREYRPARGAALAFGAGLLLSAVAEGIQPFFGRSMSGRDLLHAFYGLMAGLVVLLFFRAFRPVVRLVGSFAVVLAVLHALQPVYVAISARQSQHEIFPRLSDVSDPYSLVLWKPIRVSGSSELALSTVTNEGGKQPALRIDIAGKGPVGVEMPLPARSWKGFEELALDLTVPSVFRGRFVLRIDDCHDATRYQDRYNRRIDVQRGLNRIRIPIDEIRSGPEDRAFDLSCVKRILLFFREVSPPASVFLSRLELTLPTKEEAVEAEAPASGRSGGSS